MTALYVETSALLVIIFNEKKADEARKIIDAATVVCSSVLTFLEAKRALVRAQKDNRITMQERFHGMHLIEHFSLEWNQREIDTAIQKIATEVFPVEPVRTLDAIHLATGMEFSKLFENLKFLSFDQRILQNIEPLGFSAVKI